jgi:hypothetical protein
MHFIIAPFQPLHLIQFGHGTVQSLKHFHITPNKILTQKTEKQTTKIIQ